MARLLVLLLLVVVAVWLVRRALRAPASGAGADAAPARPAAVPEELVACARCGVLLPRPEARAAAGRHYCTEEHERLGPASGR